MSADAFGDMFAAFDQQQPDPSLPPPSDPVTPPAPPQEPPAEEPVFSSIDDMLAPPDEPVTPPTPPVPATHRPAAPATLPVTPPPFFNQFDETPPAPPAPTTPPGDAQAQLKEEFMRRLTSGDPTDAFMFAAQVGAEAAVQRMLPQVAGAKGTGLLADIDNFKRSMESADPKVFKAVEKDFNTSIGAVIDSVRKNPAALANITQEQVLEACKAHYERAKGRALDRLLANSRKLAGHDTIPAPAPAPAAPAAPPPGYGGRTGAAAPGGVQRFVPKNAREAEVYELARAAGLDDSEIPEVL